MRRFMKSGILLEVKSKKLEGRKKIRSKELEVKKN